MRDEDGQSRVRSSIHELMRDLSGSRVRSEHVFMPSEFGLGVICNGCGCAYSSTSYYILVTTVATEALHDGSWG